MNDPGSMYSGGPIPDATNEIVQRINAVRELISRLTISPAAAAPGDEAAPTADTFQRLSQRLGRLLAQAGMSDCVRAAENLERASTGLPADESLRDIDAALTYLRARLSDVAFPGASSSLSSPSQIADDMGDTDIDEGSDALDESQFSAKTLAIIRNFRNTTLRQRAPGEITTTPHHTAREISDEIPEHMRRAFLVEAASDLADLRAAIASFGKMPGNLDDLREMAQLGHKVKGTAATYLFPVIAEILHDFEGVTRILQPVALPRAEACLNLLIRFADVIEEAVHEAGDQGDASEARLVDAQALRAEAQTLLATEDTSPRTIVVGGSENSALAFEQTSERAAVQIASVHRGGDEDSLLRVEPRQLDSLMHQSDSLAMNRAIQAQSSEEIHHIQSEIDQVLARLGSLSSQLTDLHPLIRQAGDTPRAGGSGPRWLVRRETDVGTWDDLELDSYNMFDESLRALSEAVLDATTLSSALHALIQRLTRNSDAQRAVLHSMQQTIIHMRLVNLKALSDRVLLAVHQVARSVGKQVEISLLGQDIEIDRNISDTLIAPILQLVRNAVAHGIESPVERVANGKQATGNVWLHASYSGNEVSIEVGDDGRGVNPHQLIAAAISAQILDAKHADYLTRDQALALMFEQNLSTKDTAGVIAGHGIGLDSVLTAIQRLRGSIEVRSEQGRGTVFQIRVPISLSITRAVHVRVANNEYALPFSSIRHMFEVRESGILVSLPDAEPQTLAARFRRRVRIPRAAPEQPLRLPDDPTAALYDEVPVFSLAELLGLEEQPRATHMALLMDAGQRRVVVLVDEVLDESEVVIRTLPTHLRRRAVRGASIMSDGRLFLVLDVSDLLTDALGGKTIPRPRPRFQPEQLREHVTQVLVVDDSISMRRALEEPLMSAGYDVRLARDGVEALGMMIADLPDVMILDIEMPRLDGFELLSVINGNATLAQVPVVILTSRAAEKHYQQAMDLGARAYLTKPCPNDVLITTLQRVLKEPQG